MSPRTPGSPRQPGHPRRRIAGLLVLVLFLAAGSVACTGGTRRADTGQVQLSVFWWGDKKRATLTERALQLYSQRNPSVTFRMTWQGETGYYERLATQAVGGNAPDLFQIDNDHLTEYAERGIVLDLTDQVAAGRVDLSRFPPSLAQGGQINGRTVAVAAAADTPGLVYNRALLRRLGLAEPHIGMSYEEYLDWARQVTERTDGQVAGTMDPSADLRALWLWLRGQGKEFYQGRRLGFTIADLTRWFELWQQARATRATPSPAIIAPANHGEVSRQLVLTGSAAASFVWSSQLPELQRHSTDELGLVSYPGPPQAHWAHASMYWAGFRGTRHPDLVTDVINFLVNDPEAGRILGIERGLSVNLDVRQIIGAELTDTAARQVADFDTRMLDRFGPPPMPPPRGHAQLRALLIEAAESVQSGRSTAQAAAIGFVNRANVVLAS